MKIIIATLVLFSFSSFAEGTRAERRSEQQEKRIEQGIQSGELNAQEAARLRRGQERVDTAVENAGADGNVTRREKLKIEKMQDVQSKRIRRQKHDRH